VSRYCTNTQVTRQSARQTFCVTLEPSRTQRRGTAGRASKIGWHGQAQGWYPDRRLPVAMGSDHRVCHGQAPPSTASLAHATLAQMHLPAWSFAVACYDGLLGTQKGGMDSANSNRDGIMRRYAIGLRRFWRFSCDGQAVPRPRSSTRTRGRVPTTGTRMTEQRRTGDGGTGGCRCAQRRPEGIYTGSQTVVTSLDNVSDAYRRRWTPRRGRPIHLRLGRAVAAVGRDGHRRGAVELFTPNTAGGEQSRRFGWNEPHPVSDPGPDGYGGPVAACRGTSREWVCTRTSIPAARSYTMAGWS